jgi:hypothetical protein
MLSLLNDVTHWRNRAEEARGLAEHLTTRDARRAMLGIAEDCDRLAQRGEARIAAGIPKSPGPQTGPLIGHPEAACHGDI